MGTRTRIADAQSAGRWHLSQHRRRVCCRGVIAAVLYIVSNDVIAANLYPGYDRIFDRSANCPRSGKFRQVCSAVRKDSPRLVSAGAFRNPRQLGPMMRMPVLS
jgi:hypothetical protein